jgi:D-alanyl-D-alanine carboxypeptidase/D-alanyl-D-alanine-endopeptidase (penicillin-binding protein 4)
MRKAVAMLLVGIGVLWAPATALGTAGGLGPRALKRALTKDLSEVDGVHGADVVDLTSKRMLFHLQASTGRMPASVQKLYTTSTALLRLGRSAVFTTSVLGTGLLTRSGTWRGTLYLRGGGDPTFGAVNFDQAAYGTGATVRTLARGLYRAGVRRVSGRIVGDESRFDSLRGTPATGFAPSFYVEGQLSALAYDRGFSNRTWTKFQRNPPLYAARKFAAALRANGVSVPTNIPITTGDAPKGAHRLAAVDSPDVGKLIQLTNTPSDNFFAEMLLKNLGADFGGAGTTAAGARVVHRELRAVFGLRPRFNDGSGLSRYDSTSPRQVVTLLRDLSGNTTFVNSLAIAGRTGTLTDEMRGTRAQGNCRGKTGTLSDVASLVGYCTARDGHSLAFGFLLNRLSNPDTGHAVEAKMAVALANYTG